MGTSIFNIQIDNYFQKKKKPQMIQIRPLKIRRRKEVKEDPNFVDNVRFQCLVANGKF
jgi:hypothetical protein